MILSTFHKITDVKSSYIDSDCKEKSRKIPDFESGPKNNYSNISDYIKIYSIVNSNKITSELLGKSDFIVNSIKSNRSVDLIKS